MAGKVMTYREFAQVLRKNGWECRRCTGDHFMWYKEGHTMISMNIKPNPIIIERLIKEHNLILD